MNDEQLRVWDAIEEIKREQARNYGLLVEIKASLAERCVTRGDALARLRTDVDELKHRMWFFSGAAAVVGAAGTWIIKKLF